MKWGPRLLRRHRLSNSAEAGSEVVSTVLIQALVMFVVLVMLQLGFALHTRNMAISAAGEGARRGGLLGGDEDEATERTEQILSSLIGSADDRRISASRSLVNGREILTVEVTTRLPILVNMGPQWLTVRGSSLIEDGSDE